MDSGYSYNRKRNNVKWPVVAGAVVAILAVIGYLVLGNTKRFVSPLPDEPAVEIIFYTPTPEPLTPTATPSATIKVTQKPQPTATSKPEPTPTEAEATPTENP